MSESEQQYTADQRVPGDPGAYADSATPEETDAATTGVGNQDAARAGRQDSTDAARAPYTLNPEQTDIGDGPRTDSGT